MTVEATTDSLGRPARVTTLPVEVDGRTVAGAVVGKAIYEGHVEVATAVAELAGAPR